MNGKPSYRNLIGLGLHTVDTYVSPAADAGVILFATSCAWNFGEQEPGKIELGWHDSLLDSISKVTQYPPLVSLFSVPTWLDSTHKQPFQDGWMEGWTKYVRTFADRYQGRIFDVHVGTETNVNYWWPSGSPEEFIRQIVIPASLILRAHGMRAVGPGITAMEFGTSDSRRDVARDHMKRIMKANDDFSKNWPGEGFYDQLDFHSYSDTGEHAGIQNERFMLECGLWDEKYKGVIWQTETGFSEDYAHNDAHDSDWNKAEQLATGEERQLHKYQAWFPWLQARGDERDDWMREVILYHAAEDKNGLFTRNSDGSIRPKLALKWLSEQF